MLFEDLFREYASYYDGDEAERRATAVWLWTRSQEFKEKFGDWEAMEKAGRQSGLIKRAKSAMRNFDRKKDPFKVMFDRDPVNTLRMIAEQLASAGEESLLRQFPEEMLIVAAKMFAGKVPGEVSRMVDENGEPRFMDYYDDKHIMHWVFSTRNGRLEVPSFTEGEENVRHLGYPMAGQAMTKVIKELENNGLQIDSIKSTSNTTSIRGTVQEGNLFFNDDVLSTEGAVAIGEFISNHDSVSRILKNIIRNPVTDSNQAIATQMAVSVKKQPAIDVLSRTDINERYPQVIDMPVVNMFYDANNHTIVINSDISINPREYENIILEEIIHANTAHAINSNSETAALWNQQFEIVRDAFKENNQDSRYIANPTELLYGVLHDKAFRRMLQRLIVPGGNSIFDSVFGWIMKLFGFRRSQHSQVQQVLDVADQVLIRSLAAVNSSNMASVITDDGTNPLEEGERQEGEKELVEKAGTTVQIEGVGENFTGNALFDKYIKALMEMKLSIQKSRQQKTSKDKKRGLKSQAALYGKDLRTLQENLTYAELMRIGRNQVALMDRHFDTTKSLSEISENLKLLEEWQDFSSALSKDAAAEGLELEKEVIFHADKVSEDAFKLRKRYYTKLFDVFKEGMAEEHVPPDIINGINIDMTIEDIGALASSFIGLSYGQNAIEQVTDFLIRKSANDANLDWEEWEHKLKEFQKKVGKDISFMFKKDADGKNRLVTRYNPQMHEKMMKLRSEITGFDFERRPIENEIRKLTADYRAAKKIGDKDNMESITEQIDALKEQLTEHKTQTKSWDDYWEFMRQNFEYDTEMSEEDTERWEEFKENLRESYEDILGDNSVNNQYAYEMELAKYDPARFISWLKTGQNRPSHAAMWFKATPKKEWYNNEYFNSLTADQKEFYDWFTDEFVKANENIPQDDPWFGEYESDKLLRQFSYFDEAGLSKMKYLKNGIKNFAQDLVMVSYNEKDETHSVKAPLSGRLVDNIRFTDIKSLINNKEGFVTKTEGITTRIQELIDKGVYKFDEKGVVVNAKNNKPVQKIVQNEIDPLKTFVDFKKLSLSYKYKKQVEDYLNTAKEMAFDAEVVQKSSDGRVLKKFGQMATAKGSNNVESRIATTVDAYLYKNTKNPFSKKVSEPGKKQFSIEQTIETLNNYTRARQLGLNFASGITNLAMGTIGNWQYAARGEFFNEKELRKAYWLIKGSVATLGYGKSQDAQKLMLFLRRFNLLGSFQENMLLDNQAMEKLMNNLFVFQKGGEFMNQGSVMVAMMLRAKLKGTDTALWDSFDAKDGELVPKAGKLNEEQLDDLRKFGNAVLQVNKDIHGDYDPLNMQQIKKKQIGRILMMFRTWMPMAIKSRLGKAERDYILSDYAGKDIYREGRWNTLARYTSGKGWKTGSGNALKFVAAAIASTVPGANFGKKIIDTMGVSDKDKANMYVNLKELWWLMAISTVAMVLKKFAEDIGDDDEEKRTKKRTGSASAAGAWFNYLTNQASRVSNDLWFFYDPTSAARILRDPVAIGATVKQMVKISDAAKNYVFDNDSDIYKRGFRKGDSKFATSLEMFFPVIRQGESLHSMWEQVYNDKPF
jgi:hypothetical protein